MSIEEKSTPEKLLTPKELVQPHHDNNVATLVWEFLKNQHLPQCNLNDVGDDPCDRERYLLEYIKKVTDIAYQTQWRMKEMETLIGALVHNHGDVLHEGELEALKQLGLME